MDVSIIIVNYNTLELTRNCLKSVFEKTKGIDFEVYVVDNASTDGSCHMIENEFPQVKIIRNKDNVGFGKANNIAMRKSEAKYVFLLNSDTILLNNAVKIFFDYMEKEENKKVVVCGGTLYSTEKQPVPTYGHFPSMGLYIFRFGLYKIFPKYYEKHYNLCVAKKIEEPIEVDYIIGADFFARKSVMDEMDYFDEKFFMYMEEVDLCKRIKKKYNIKAIPDAEIIHINCGSTENNIHRWEIQMKSLFIYLRNHYSKLYVSFVKAIHILKYLLAILINPKMIAKYSQYIKLIVAF